ncbi:MAG TPA: DoxX family protein [Gemmatimonadaceae bacterium]|nr:DoxX family protein [Gemmatimonadaceae bacterium]
MSRIIRKSAVLWTIQTLVALVFLFAGASKFLMPPEAMQQGPIVLPLAFIRFIGVCEITGALGLLLPGLLRIGRGLTPIAALGLVLIMSGATAITIESGMVGGAAVPLVIGVLASIIAYGRAGWSTNLRVSI